MSEEEPLHIVAAAGSGAPIDDERSPFLPEWADIPDHWLPLKDSDGNPITFDWRQIQAMNHAVSVWLEIKAKYDTRWDGQIRHVDMMKSRLLGRMMIQGLPPHKYPPPLEMSGGWWELVEHGRCGFSKRFAPYDNGTYLNIWGHPWVVFERSGNYITLVRRPGETSEKWIYRPVRDEAEAHRYQCGTTIENGPAEPIWADFILERME